MTELYNHTYMRGTVGALVNVFIASYLIGESILALVRILALSCISYGGYKLQPYAMYHLSKFLMMKESDVKSLFLQCGLEVSTSGIKKGLSCTKPSVIHKPARGFEKYYPMDAERIERYLQYELFREHHFFAK